MSITRKESLALIGAAVLHGCGARQGSGIVVGSKNFAENITIAEIYAAALERAGLPVQRRMNLGSTQIAIAGMQRGDIDLYPEYTGTGLIDVLHMPPQHDAASVFATVKREFERRYGLTWLTPSPVNDSQALATTRPISQKYALRTLSQCAVLAPRLHLAAVPEFVARADALPGLQRFYGGFAFRETRIYTIGLQYDALMRGDADVATAFTTDSQILQNGLVVLEDDKKFWPPYNVAPVVRTETLHAHPQIAGILNRIAPALTDAAVRRLNVEVNVRKTDPADAAAAFIRSI